MTEVYNILKFIEKDYKSWDEIRKHFAWSDDEARVKWGRYFEPEKFIRPKTNRGSGPEQSYTASDEGKRYLEQNSFWSKISSNQLVVGVILLIIGVIIGYFVKG